MKVVGWIAGIVVVLILGAVAFLVLNSGSLIETAIEELGPEYLGAPVGVGGVDLSLTEGSASITDLAIGNPEGYGGGNAMSLGEVKVTLDTGQISDTLVVMKQVLIDSANVAAVAKGSQTNFQKLMENVEQATGTTSAPAAETETGAEMKFIIERFDFTNASASLNSDVLGDMELSLPDIHLTDIGRKSNGATALELTQEILRPITSAISKAAIAQGVDLEGVKEKVTEQVKEKIGEGLRGLLKRD